MRPRARGVCAALALGALLVASPAMARARAKSTEASGATPGAVANAATTPPTPAAPRVRLSLPEPAPFSLLGARILRAPPVDALPVCLPDDVGPDVAMVVKHARETDAHEALAKLEPLRQREDAEESGAGLVARILEARAADGAALDAAFEALGESDASEHSAGRRFCARIERGRAALRRGRLPEAGAEAVRAARLRSELPNPVAAGEAADFLRAEALHAAGRTKDAWAIFDRLVRSEEPRIALASRLRVTDARFDVDGPAFARADYDALLPKLSSIGVAAGGWALRSAEAALAFGDADTAVRQLELSLTGVRSPERASVARLRIADAYAAKGELETARGRWGALAEEQPDTPFGRFAGLRLEATRDPTSAPRGRIERLDRILDGAPAPLLAWGRVLRGRAWLEAGDLDRALDDLARLSRETVPEAVAPLLADALATATRRVSEESVAHGGCEELVRRLGVVAQSLVPRSSDPDPFLRLGRCYEDLGITPGARAIYAAIARGFGPDVVALGTARVALDAGERERARSALESIPKGATVDADELEAVRGSLELADGDAASAAVRLAKLLDRREAAHQPTDVPLLQQLARALSRANDADAALVWRLAATLESTPPATRRAAADRFGEAAYLIGRMLVAMQQPGPGMRLLQEAATSLPAGPLRAEAGVRLGELLPKDDDADAALERAANERPAGNWARLAAVVRRIGDVRSTLGMERRPGALLADVASAPLELSAGEVVEASHAGSPSQESPDPLPLGTPSQESSR